MGRGPKKWGDAIPAYFGGRFGAEVPNLLNGELVKVYRRRAEGPVLLYATDETVRDQVLRGRALPLLASLESDQIAREEAVASYKAKLEAAPTRARGR